MLASTDTTLVLVDSQSHNLVGISIKINPFFFYSVYFSKSGNTPTSKLLSALFTYLPRVPLRKSPRVAPPPGRASFPPHVRSTHIHIYLTNSSSFSYSSYWLHLFQSFLDTTSSRCVALDGTWTAHRHWHQVCLQRHPWSRYRFRATYPPPGPHYSIKKSHVASWGRVHSLSVVRISFL